jgi:hypothetical protein
MCLWLITAKSKELNDSIHSHYESVTFTSEAHSMVRIYNHNLLLSFITKKYN